jgi:acyl dehydratase
MIDRRWIGHTLPASTFDIERGRLKFFAKAIGETDPVYLDESAARRAGHPDLPAPPTFLFAAELDSGTLLGMFDDLGVALADVLHGEQGFTYRRMLHAGDRVTVESRITDIYDRKGGALEFIVKDSRVTDAGGAHVADLRATLVVRNGARR